MCPWTWRENNVIRRVWGGGMSREMKWLLSCGISDVICDSRNSKKNTCKKIEVEIILELILSEDDKISHKSFNDITCSIKFVSLHCLKNNLDVFHSAFFCCFIALLFHNLSLWYHFVYFMRKLLPISEKTSVAKWAIKGEMMSTNLENWLGFAQYFLLLPVSCVIRRNKW